MMEFEHTPSGLRLKQEARAFLDENLTDDVRRQVHETGTFHSDSFHKSLAERGWLALEWPEEYGGAGKDPFEVVAIREEFADASAPMYGAATTMMIAGVIREIGTDAQKAEMLPRVLSGDVVIVLGFTEPESGSDVAAAATKAVRDGEEWVINGQKMFTTNAHVADYVFLLARTNPDVPKHKGLTTFLVPLDQEGVDVQAVMTMSGERTNITYYDDVRVSDVWRIGEVDEGWATMNVALTLERVGASGGEQRKAVAAVETWALAASAHDGGRPIDDDRVAVRLMRAAAEARVTRLLGLRSVWSYTTGSRSGVEGSMAKLFGSECLVRMTDDLAMLSPELLVSAADPTKGSVEEAVRHAQPGTIYGGTSEVQRSIIAQHGLGLPRAR